MATTKKTTGKKAAAHKPGARKVGAVSPANATAGAYKPRKWTWGVHPGVAMVRKWETELPEKTGRSLAQWIKLVKADGPETTKARIAWLKQAHKLGTNSAWWLVERAEGRVGEEGDPKYYVESAQKYVEQMYEGAKASLRPLFDELMELSLSIGKDVKACPCQTMVPIYRANVIATIKPTTRTRIDYGLALGDTKAPAGGRLIDTGGFAKKDRITHRIEIACPSDIDSFVEKWLRVAYERNAK